MTQESTHLPAKEPVAEAKSTQTNTKHTRSYKSMNNPGYFVDGWSDLVEGMGDKVKSVRNKVVEQLEDREMPDIEIDQVIGRVSRIGMKEERRYTITTTSPGITTTVYVGKHGKDLYVSWRTFIHLTLNILVIVLIFGISATFGFMSALGWALVKMLGNLQFGFGLFGFSLEGFLTTFVLASFGPFILSTLLVAFAGIISKGSFLWYFFVEPSLFDGEDMVAMGLSAHKSILRALDNVGIDTSKLRLKQDYKSGRRGELV